MGRQQPRPPLQGIRNSVAKHNFALQGGSTRIPDPAPEQNPGGSNSGAKRFQLICTWRMSIVTCELGGRTRIGRLLFPVRLRIETQATSFTWESKSTHGGEASPRIDFGRSRKKTDLYMKDVRNDMEIAPWVNRPHSLGNRKANDWDLPKGILGERIGVFFDPPAPTRFRLQSDRSRVWETGRPLKTSPTCWDPA